MNHFAFIDYHRPIGQRNDYRTSSYRGHLFLHDTMPSSHIKSNKIPCTSFYTQGVVEGKYLSEQQENYTKKDKDPNIISNPSLMGRSLKLMKTYEEARLLLPPKSLQELKSTYNTDFIQVSAKDCILSFKLPLRKPIRIANKQLIERDQVGYTKYLDTSATTSRLDYIPYRLEQWHANGTQDNVTYWKWIQEEYKKKYNVSPIKQSLCDKTTSQKCIKRRNEYQNTCKFVPNAGLTTESRNNFKSPISIVEFKFHINPNTIDSGFEPFQNQTENSIYGSGERLDKFINTKSKSRSL